MSVTSCATPLAAVFVTAAITATTSAGDGCASEIVMEAEVGPLLPHGATEWFIVDVKVVAPDDMWVVGTYDVPGLGGGYQEEDQLGLTLHYDGTRWSFVESPDPTNPVGERSIELNAVDAVNADNVFSGGDYHGAAAGAPDTFAMQWDGGDWEHLPSPGISVFGAQGHLFMDVEAIDTGNIWFGGSTEYGISGTSNPYMVHFDGSNFTDHLLPLAPNTTGGHLIRSISAISADDIWVAGDYGGNSPGVGSSYVARGSGSSWQHVPTPELGFGEIVYAITAIAPDDVWICGRYQVAPPEGGPVISHPLYLHYDGTGWEQFEVDAFAYALYAFGPDDVYAGARTLDFHPALLHWDGNEWSIAAELETAAGPFWSLDGVGPCELMLITGDDIYRYRTEAQTGDVDHDGVIGVNDLVRVIMDWGTCGDCAECVADMDGDCTVGVDDLVMVLTHWSE